MRCGGIPACKIAVPGELPRRLFVAYGKPNGAGGPSFVLHHQRVIAKGTFQFQRRGSKVGKRRKRANGEESGSIFFSR
jgi:hypothetical protein